jgi:hypothetical protein
MTFSLTMIDPWFTKKTHVCQASEGCRSRVIHENPRKGSRIFQRNMYASARIAVLGTSHNKLTSIIDTRPTYFVECVVNKTS